MSLRERINSDIKTAMRGAQEDQNEKMRLSTLRLLLSEIKNAEIDKKKELDDDEIIDVISKQIKRRKESIKSFLKGDREEMAKKETQEMEILSVYMPAQLSKDEIAASIEKIIGDLKAKGPVNMGLVMKEIMAKLKGKADGKLVSEIVSKALSEKD